MTLIILKIKLILLKMILIIKLNINKKLLKLNLNIKNEIINEKNEESKKFRNSTI